MEPVVRNRSVHYDLLRILAAFSVVMLHSAAQYWYVLPVTGIDWKIANAYDACFRFGVPVFVMISGAIFLDPSRELDVKYLYKHNILRFIIVYMLWSAIYGMQACYAQGISDMDWKQILVKLSRGQYHLWYLPMLVGIYILLPVLRSWILHAEVQNIRYFLGLFLILQILRVTVMSVVRNKDVLWLLDLGEIQMACSYLGYFVLGYYIVHVGIPSRLHKYFYLAVVPAAVMNVLVSTRQSVSEGIPRGEFYDSYGIFTFLMVVGIFLFFTQKVKKCSWKNVQRAFIEEISKGTLGVYLMHIGVIDLLKRLGIDSAMVPVVGIPLFAVIVFGISYVLAALLRRIPIVGRYLC